MKEIYTYLDSKNIEYISVGYEIYFEELDIPILDYYYSYYRMGFSRTTDIDKFLVVLRYIIENYETSEPILELLSKYDTAQNTFNYIFRTCNIKEILQ